MIADDSTGSFVPETSVGDLAEFQVPGFVLIKPWIM